MSDYPKVKYLRSLQTVTVHSKEEEDGLVGEWGDGPLDFGIITAPGADGVTYDLALDKFKAAAPAVPAPPQEPSEPVAVSTSAPEPPAAPEDPAAPAQV